MRLAQTEPSSSPAIPSSESSESDMNRPRKHDKHLPACVYLRRGTYYYVKAGKWNSLGRDLESALKTYARIISEPKEGLPALIDEVLPHITKKVAPSTRKQYERAAGTLRDVLAEFRPADLKPHHIRTMLDSYEHIPASANRLLVVLKAVLQWAVDHGRLDANPAREVRRYAQTPRSRLITPAEYSAIYEHATPRLRAVMDLCYLTGQRVGDVLTIKRTQLTNEGIAFTQQKTKARLVVAWTPELTEAVARAKALTGNVAYPNLIVQRGGASFAYSYCWRLWKSACKKAGVEGVTIHDLRAAAATQAQAEGLPAQKLLGHKSARTTEIYLRDKTIPVVRGPKRG